VLVVDDHELNAESLSRALGAEDDLIVVGSAVSCAGALQAARRLRPDVVVVHSHLSDGTGVEATALIKAELPDTEVVVLMVEPTGAALAAALEAGCSGFVDQESQFDELVRTIRSVSDGTVNLPPSLVVEIATHLRPRPDALGADLTPREREVLQLLAVGKSTSELVDSLNLSIHTVRNHIRKILEKLDARSRLEAVAIATRNGIVEWHPG
jgi:DNA-binding NarL/FixJ family response regulator